MVATQIGQWMVSSDAESFRIFPKNRFGETIPVTRINKFIYLQCVRTGSVVTFKRYLHQRQWHWRDSREKKPQFECDVISEVARMLGVPRERAQRLVSYCVS